jgi:hypothetical protein
VRTVLGSVREYLVDADPTRVTINFRRGTEAEVIVKDFPSGTKAEVTQKLTMQWEALRRPLASLAIRHPSKEVRSLTDALIVEVHWVLHWDSWALADFARGADWQEAYKQGRVHHEKARSTLTVLREALHGALVEATEDQAAPDET